MSKPPSIWWRAYRGPTMTEVFLDTIQLVILVTLLIIARELRALSRSNQQLMKSLETQVTNELAALREERRAPH
jgi:hypothetical protein